MSEPPFFTWFPRSRFTRRGMTRVRNDELIFIFLIKSVDMQDGIYRSSYLMLNFSAKNLTCGFTLLRLINKFILIK